MYYSPRAITVIQSMRMRWVGHVERIHRRNSYKNLGGEIHIQILVGNSEGERSQEDLDVGGR
jgi:hypothetical protein